MTIRVINKAPIPQRLHILPPNSQFFSIKVDKKGILSTGMSESIELHFQPTEYKYGNNLSKVLLRDAQNQYGDLELPCADTCLPSIK